MVGIKKNSQIFQCVKFHAKIKKYSYLLYLTNALFEKNALFDYFPKNPFSYYQCPRIWLIANFGAKIKILKFRTKNALIGCSGQQLRKTIVIFEISTLQFAYLQNLQKTKMPKFGTKNALSGYFWARILKNYRHIWNQHSRIYLWWVFNWCSEFWYSVCFFLKVWGPLFLKAGFGFGFTF